MKLRVVPYGPEAFLVQFSAASDAQAFAVAHALLAAVDLHPPRGLREATPGFATLLLEFRPGEGPTAESLLEPLQAVADQVARTPTALAARQHHVLPVRYDGPDLERVARHAGLSVAEVIRVHTAPEYRVHLLGFAPGFPYLTGLDPRLHTPRLDSPRPRIDAGSVAIGGRHTGIYPLATAGGWNLLGRTTVNLVDHGRAGEGRSSAFLLQPGDAVRFQVQEGP